MFQESKTRTIAKTILWRVIATLITWSVIYSFTGQFYSSSKITIVAAIASMTAYYIFERTWNKIQWGKQKNDNIG